MQGQVISLEAAGTAVVVQGRTSAMAPVTAVVTVTRGTGGGGVTGGGVGAAVSNVGEEPGSGEKTTVVGGVVVLLGALVGGLGVWL